ncbi:hypothetical protein ABGB12_20500 [Actinocorallia sp. B10E7]|uniref:hypothetical protein n=1 Tax=Actinocorallia sp. B10E7 TaxID=3153558 RepID=UPI00325C8C3D
MRCRVLVCSMALVAGCSGGGGGDDAPPKSGADVPRGDVAVADPGKALARATFDGPSGKIELAVVSLTARGRLANLALSLTPHHPDKTSMGAFLYFGYYVPEATLVDPVNLKRYLVVKDSEGAALGAGNVNYNLNQPNTLQYTFAAPPENVKSIDVHFGDFPPFRNVPISR